MALNDGLDYNLRGFRTQIGDYTRSHMFKLYIPQVGPMEQISVFARSTTLPDYEIQTAGIEFQGIPIQVATVAKFSNSWTVKFLADEAQVLRNRLYSWSSTVYDANHMQGSSMSYYKSDEVKAYQLARDGSVITTYQFYGLFPKKVKGFEFDHKNVDPQTFEVDFSYDFFSINAEVKTDNIDSMFGVDVAGKSNLPTGKSAIGKTDAAEIGTQGSARNPT
jgi:hypothetical protein